MTCVCEIVGKVVKAEEENQRIRAVDRLALANLQILDVSLSVVSTPAEVIRIAFLEVVPRSPKIFS